MNKNNNNLWPNGESSDPSDWPQPLHDNLQHFLDYWHSIKTDAGKIPARADMHPRNMAHYLPGIMIIERVMDGGRPRFQYRLTGEDAFTVSGRQLKGLYIDEIYPADIVNETTAIFNRILQTGAPNYLVRQNPFPDRDFIQYERILTPLLDADGKATLLMGLWVCQWS